jgi:hypothetical protein
MQPGQKEAADGRERRTQAIKESTGLQLDSLCNHTMASGAQVDVAQRADVGRDDDRND